MMKKLLMWSALLMTGFAFYSCDDVIDNPAQGDSTVWKCTTNVKFADFDFNGIPDPETSEPYAFEAPKTLYVFNEQLEPLGTIETETPPAAGISAKYTGNLTGTIGDNLILTTKVGTDYAKQDGSLKSVVENGIVQVAKVAVRMYSTPNHELTTYDAKMENEVAIAHLEMGLLNAGSEITVASENIASDDKMLTLKVGEDVKTWDLYVAVPIDLSKEFDYTLLANKANGEIASAEMEDLTLEKGKINTLNPETLEPYHIPQKILGIDLTKYDAYMRSSEDPGDAWYMDNINNGWIPTYWYGDGDDYSFIVTQSGEATLDSLSVNFSGNIDKKATLTISNVRLGEDCYFQVQGGATFDITLIDENKFGMLNLNSPFAKKGTGTWEFNELNVGGATHFDGESNLVVDYAAEYTITEDIDFNRLSVYDGGIVTIADGKTVNIINEKQYKFVFNVYKGTLNIGKAAKFNAENKYKDQTAARVIGNLNIGEKAEVNIKGAKGNTALEINDNTWDTYGIKTKVNIGKNAKVNLDGAPSSDSFGSGISISSIRTTIELDLEEGAILNATSVDRTAFKCETRNNYYPADNDPVININIAKDAKLIVEDIEGGRAFEVDHRFGVINIDGKGTFEAKSKSNVAMDIYGWGYPINFMGGNILATGGKDKPAIDLSVSLTIGEKITSFKAQKGADATEYISNGGSEALLEDLVADKTKFNDVTADGVRTITPKPAEE